MTENASASRIEQAAERMEQAAERIESAVGATADAEEAIRVRENHVVVGEEAHVVVGEEARVIGLHLDTASEPEG